MQIRIQGRGLEDITTIGQGTILGTFSAWGEVFFRVLLGFGLFFFLVFLEVGKGEEGSSGFLILYPVAKKQKFVL